MAKAKEEVIILTPEEIQEIESEISVVLVKENVTEKLFTDMEAQYGGLTIKGQEDKEGYLNVQEARKAYKKVRVLVKKVCEKGREKANAESAAWIAKQKVWTERALTPETRLEKMETDYEAERDRLKAEREAKLEQQSAERMRDLISFGAKMEGLYWSLNDVQYEIALVKGCDAGIYSDIRAKFEAEFNKAEAIRLEKEENERKERDKLAQQQEELRQQQAELQRQQEELNRQKKDARIRLTNERVAVLSALGVHWSAFDNAFVGWGVHCRKEEFDAALEDESFWVNIMADIEFIVSDMKEKDRIKKEQEAAEAEEKRTKDLETARLEGIGKGRRDTLNILDINVSATNLELATLSEEEWRSYYEVRKIDYDDRQKKIADQQEKDRQELLSETQKYKELVKAIKAIEVPSFRSGQYRAKAKIILDFMDGLK